LKTAQIRLTLRDNLETVRYRMYVNIIKPTGSCVAQLAERRSLAGELTLSCARPSADGWLLCR